MPPALRASRPRAIRKHDVAKAEALGASLAGVGVGAGGHDAAMSNSVGVLTRTSIERKFRTANS